MDFRFIGGSMGSVVGKKLLVHRTMQSNTNFPLVIISKSGGARMMESATSLMQMAKTSAKLAQLAEAKFPTFLFVLIPLQEELRFLCDARGHQYCRTKGFDRFAGPRVVKDTTGKELPEGFQTSEFQLEKGFLDFISHRNDLKD